MAFNKIRGHLDEVAYEIKCWVTGMYPPFVMKASPSWNPNQFPVFTLHGVDPISFEEEMRYLENNGYRTFTLEDLKAFMKSESAQNPNGVLVTFDDGYESVWTLGGPILKKHGQKAVAYVVPSLVGKPGYLTWEQINQMRESGIFEIHSHSQTHRVMQPENEADLADLEHELATSKREIEQKVPGQIVTGFCFPYGKGSHETVRIGERLGYTTVAWSTIPKRCANSPGQDPLYIVRVKHDFIPRLPGRGRKSLLSIFFAKIRRRVVGKAFA